MGNYVKSLHQACKSMLWQEGLHSKLDLAQSAAVVAERCEHSRAVTEQVVENWDKALPVRAQTAIVHACLLLQLATFGWHHHQLNQPWFA